MAVRKLKLFVLTAASGAGRSTAEQAFEDVGFRVISGLPTSLWAASVEQTLEDKFGSDGVDQNENAYLGGLVLSVQSNPAFVDTSILQRALVALRQWPEIQLQHIHLTCDTPVLVQRFSTTRRRHPFAMDRPLEDGIRAEESSTKDLQTLADLHIDTSLLKPKDLIFHLQSLIPTKDKTKMVVSVSSFAFGNGLPREADFVFDARFLRNPHYDPALKDRTGREKEVADYVKADEVYRGFFDGIKKLIQVSLPRFELEGKSYLTVAIGCTGGRHRSVTIAENLASDLKALGYDISLKHRDS